ncbi:MAG TPA: glutamine amidotransferase, partial [Alcanivorax sp.]|nr:glutamine amidotransferase [Alcanivorax sp.]
MKPLLILQTGSTYPALQRHYGDFPDWIRQGLGDQAPVTVVDAREGQPLPGAAGFSGVVITGSHHMVTDEAGWMRHLMHWLE